MPSEWYNWQWDGWIDVPPMIVLVLAYAAWKVWLAGRDAGYRR